MPLTLQLRSLKFSNGEIVDIARGDIIAIVGPNNAGKSQVLKDIYDSICSRKPTPVVVVELTSEREGSDDDFIELLIRHSEEDREHAGYRRTANLRLTSDGAKAQWRSEKLPMPEIGWLLCNLVETKDRLSQIDPPGSYDPEAAFKTHILHYVQSDYDAEIAISNAFRQAFAADFIVNPFSQGRVYVHVGNRPKHTLNQQPITDAIKEQYSMLPKLHLQGDGMKGFASVVMQVSFGGHPIKLIDEPEAFLHPPQARMLGRWIAENHNDQYQTIIATHDAYFLKGLLDVSPSNLKVIRIERDQQTNIPKLLENSDINELWANSVLRYSRAMEALFHEVAILCEGDSDVRFFEAIFDALFEIEQEKSTDKKIKLPDCLITQCSGKHAFPKFVTALRKAGVPTRIIADIDLLDDATILERLIDASGGDWSEVSDSYKMLSEQIQQKVKPLKRHEVRTEILSIIESANAEHLGDSEVESLRSTLKKTSHWKLIKKRGKEEIPSDAYSCYEQICNYLKGLGVYVLDCGELEGFNRNLLGSKQAWLRQALESDLKCGPAWIAARDFFHKILLGERVTPSA